MIQALADEFLARARAGDVLVVILEAGAPPKVGRVEITGELLREGHGRDLVTEAIATAVCG